MSQFGRSRQMWRTMPSRTNPNHHQLTNHDYFDGHVAWFVTDSLTLVGAYAYTGDKDRFYRDGRTDRLGVGGGFVLSVQYQF